MSKPLPSLTLRVLTCAFCAALQVPALASGTTKDDFEYWDANANGDLTCSEALDRDEGLRLPAHRDNTNDTALIYEWLARVRGDSDNDGIDCESENNPNGYVPQRTETSPPEPIARGCPNATASWRGLRVCEELPREGYDRDDFGSPYSFLEDEIIAGLPRISSEEALGREIGKPPVLRLVFDAEVGNETVEQELHPLGRKDGRAKGCALVTELVILARCTHSRPITRTPKRRGEIRSCGLSPT